MTAHAFRAIFAALLEILFDWLLGVKLMAHFRLDPPRINKEVRRHPSSYCHECLERFMAADVRCSYGTRFFHKECYKRWQEKRAFQCA